MLANFVSTFALDLSKSIESIGSPDLVLMRHPGEGQRVYGLGFRTVKIG